jgi:hypothetical protein
MLKGASAEVMQSAQMDGDKFTPEQIERFEKDRDYYRSFIKATEEQVNSRFRTVRIPYALLVESYGEVADFGIDGE